MANLEDKKDVRPVQPPVQNESVTDQLARLELRQRLEDEALRDEAKQQKRASQLAGIEAMKIRMRLEKDEQDQCAHQNPYGGTLLVGQRLHSNKHIFMCQNCRKTWFDNEVPLHLRIVSERVGGPNY